MTKNNYIFVKIYLRKILIFCLKSKRILGNFIDKSNYIEIIDLFSLLKENRFY